MKIAVPVFLNMDNHEVWNRISSHKKPYDWAIEDLPGMYQTLKSLRQGVARDLARRKRWGDIYGFQGYFPLFSDSQITKLISKFPNFFTGVASPGYQTLKHLKKLALLHKTLGTKPHSAHRKYKGHSDPEIIALVTQLHEIGISRMHQIKASDGSLHSEIYRRGLQDFVLRLTGRKYKRSSSSIDIKPNPRELLLKAVEALISQKADGRPFKIIIGRTDLLPFRRVFRLFTYLMAKFDNRYAKKDFEIPADELRMGIQHFRISQSDLKFYPELFHFLHRKRLHAFPEGSEAERTNTVEFYCRFANK